MTVGQKRLESRIEDAAVKLHCNTRLYRSWPFDVGVQEAIECYQDIAIMLAENEDKVGKNWDETDAGLAKVILNERQHYRAVVDKARHQK